MPSKDWSASAELNNMRKAGITGSSNPVRNRLETQELLRNVRTGGSFASDVARMPTEGRERLNTMGGRVNMEGGVSRTLGRTAAATGSDAQWAWPKLHDPFEYWRELSLIHI